MTARIAGLALALAMLSGCYRMTIRNGQPVGNAPIEYDDKWHHGFIFGLAEVSGPYDLSKVCAKGWAEIHTETSFLTGLVTALTWQIYTPQSVTIRCAAK
jgi:hypothetical protein